LKRSAACIPDASRGANLWVIAAIGVARAVQQRSIAMQTNDNVQIDASLQPMTDHDCEQIAGGLDYGALITLGVELIELVMTCVIAGVPCFA
jgi:hypothetical protein